MKYVLREIESELKQLITEVVEHKNVILIEGARQVGKSCLVEHILKAIKSRKIQLNLETAVVLKSKIDRCREFSEFQDLLENEFEFNPKVKSILFIDEAQESMMLGSFVRSMKEQWPATTVILTGSALNRLFRNNVRYPVGRVTKIVVRPFSFIEYLRATGKNAVIKDCTDTKKDLSATRHNKLTEYSDQYLTVGGLPEVVLAYANGKDYKSIQEQILASYEQDFIRLFGEDVLYIAQGCLRSVANFVGFPSKISSVVSQPTNKTNDAIKGIFSRLENWHLILKSPQFGSSATASHKYLPKRYLFDTGILRCLREAAVPSISVLNTLDPASRTPLGGILENQTAGMLLSMGFELSGWKKSPSGMEIDFVAKKGDSLIPIECKSALTINKTHLKGIFEYLSLHKLKTGIIISFAPFSKIEYAAGTTVFNLPFYRMQSLNKIID